MTIITYKPNERDKPILEEISALIADSLDGWYGAGSYLDAFQSEIRSYRNCFIIRYPITRSNGTKKAILVKIRRNPKMDSLWRAVTADIHKNIPTEYGSLVSVFDYLAGVNDEFGVIRPLAYIEKYHAIIMEEYPSRTLRQILINQRSSQDVTGMNDLMDAAEKTGKWLYFFHHKIHRAVEVPYSTKDVIQLVESYAYPLERYSNGSIQARSILDAFSRRLENITFDSVLFSQSHADMTCDNVLYSDDKKVCVIDIKTRPAPIFSDLGLILTHPETFKLQILSGGIYLPKFLLRKYRAAILTGYFGTETENAFFVKLFSAVKVLDKWTMYEELISKYKGIKHLLSFPVGPHVTAYFRRTLVRHLNSLGRETENMLDPENDKPARTTSGPWMSWIFLFGTQLYQACLEINIFLAA